MTRLRSILHRLRVESPSSSSTAGPQSRHEHSEAMSISVAWCTIKENRLQLRRGLNRPATHRRRLLTVSLLRRGPRPGGRPSGLRVPLTRIQSEIVSGTCRESARAAGSAARREGCGKADCHQTIVNALASCRRAAGDERLGRRVRCLCHRRNFSQSLFSVPVFSLVLCIV
jgi:hypothetical protein